MAVRNGRSRSSHLTCLQGQAISQVVSSDRSEDSSAEDKRCRTKVASSQGKHFGCSFCARRFIQKKPGFRRFKLSALTTSSSLPRFPSRRKGGTIAGRGVIKT